MNDKRASFYRPLRVRKVHSWRTFLWLSRGFSDFMNAPLVGLLHGLAMGAFGGAAGLIASSMPSGLGEYAPRPHQSG